MEKETREQEQKKTYTKSQEIGYLSQLLSLSKALNSSLNLEEVLSMAMEQVVNFIQAERGFIMLFNDQGELELKAHKNVEPEKFHQGKEFSKTIINMSAEHGNNVMTVDAQQDSRFKNLESVMLTGMRSVLCVPLKVKNKIIGIVYLDNRVEQGMFNQDHLDMLSAFSNLASIAIDNASLYENLIKSYDDRFRLTQELHQQEKIRLASEEANRLKSEFVSIVSHELRSPLTVIKAYSSTLYKDEAEGKHKLSEEMKLDIYKTVDREVDRLLGMINKLLDVSRIDAGKSMVLEWKETDVVEILKNVLKFQKTSKFYKKNHHITVAFAKNIPSVYVDRDRLWQILSNLIENALKYSPHGGEVQVSLTYDDNFVRFVISDQGVGISPEDQQKLFQKFERFESPKNLTIPGTGLGLYYVKHLIELHGGGIEVKSESGKGSEFAFTLSRSKKEERVEEIRFRGN